jgi:hypothetical protein
MTRRWQKVGGLLLLVPVMLLAGCAAGGAYRGAASADTSVNTVPPSFYGNDPALRQWYTAPYFDPYEMP